MRYRLTCGDDTWRDENGNPCDEPVGHPQCGSPFSHKPKGWPQHSDSAGCHPSQAGEYYEDSVRRGVPTQFDPDTGQAIFTSRLHRKKYCEARGITDRNAGYGDPTNNLDPGLSEWRGTTSSG